jgi:hypothetical protein
MTETYRECLRSPEWQARRKHELQRAGNKCQLCSGRHRLEVHHNTYERVGAEWSTDLIVLCRACHGWHHRRLAARALAPSPSRSEVEAVEAIARVMQNRPEPDLEGVEAVKALDRLINMRF